MLATLSCQSVGPASDLEQTGTRELQTDLGSEDNQQTDTREETKDLRSEAKQQTGTRELPTDFRSEAGPTDWHKRVANIS
jgi:hypothetical protein